MLKRAILALFVAGAVAIAVGVSDSQAEAPAQTTRSHAEAVKVAPVTDDQSGTKRRFTASVRAVEQATLAFTVGGRVEKRPVELGDTIAKGDLLAQLDLRAFRNQVSAASASLAQADARLDQSRLDRDRTDRLVAAAAAADAEAEHAQSSVAVLEATRQLGATNVRESKRLLGEASLRAPFAGRVTQVLVEPGELVAAGQPVAILTGESGLEIEFDVPEDVLPHLAAGRTVPIDLPRLGRRVEGTVTAVGGATPTPGRLFPVVVRLARSDGLAPGMSAEVELTLSRERSLRVPVEAVVDPGGKKPAVFRVQEGVVEAVPVVVLGLSDAGARVLGSLAAGEAVVVRGHGRLVDGQRVEAVQ